MNDSRKCRAGGTLCGGTADFVNIRKNVLKYDLPNRMVYGKAQTVMEPYRAKHGDEIKDMNASEEDAGIEHEMCTDFSSFVEDSTVESENILTTYVVTQEKLTQFD